MMWENQLEVHGLVAVEVAERGVAGMCEYYETKRRDPLDRARSSRTRFSRATREIFHVTPVPRFIGIATAVSSRV